MRLKLEILGSIIIVILLGLIGWEQYHKALATATAEIEARTLAKAQARQDQALSQRDQQYRQDLKAMDQRYQRLAKMTPAEVVTHAPDYVPLASTPITIWGPNVQPPNEGDAIVPAADIKPLAAAILDGQKCKLDLTKCQGDVGDWQQKFTLKEQESKKWEQAAKGGSWLQRLGKDVLKVGIGVAVGYAAHR